MFRIIWLVLLLPSLAAAGQWVDKQPTAQNQTRPNILLIVAEDMSSRVGAYGDSVARTPSLDGLAQQGTRFTNVFTVSGVCAPSRSALITGVQPISMGTQHMRTRNLRELGGSINYDAVPPEEVKAFPELLRRAGYATANLAKTDYQFGEPFTIWDMNNADYFPGDLALWRDLPPDKPFFVMLNMMVTHESFLAPPVGEGSDTTNPMLVGIAGMREKLITPVTDPADVTVPPYLPDTPAVRASIAQHYDNIHHMDKQVGEILRELEADGLADNTIVIWTTDHGDGFPRAKRSVYDSGLKVPMIIRYPDGDRAGAVNRQLVSFVDIAPTILGFAGLEAPEFIQGRNLIDGSPRHYIYAARDRMDEVPDRVRAVRDNRFKYIRTYLPEEPYFRPLPFRDMFPIMAELWSGHEAETLTAVQKFYFAAPRPLEELYDTQNDPHEISNLTGNSEYAEVLTRLREEMDYWLEQTGDLSELAEMEMIASMWPGLKQPVTASPEASYQKAKEGNRLVILSSSTPGASIGYRVVTGSESADSNWSIYTGPVELPAGHTLETKAIRYGYAESPVTAVANGKSSGS